MERVGTSSNIPLSQRPGQALVQPAGRRPSPDSSPYISGITADTEITLTQIVIPVENPGRALMSRAMLPDDLNYSGCSAGFSD